jgi:hypothetical protein
MTDGEVGAVYPTKALSNTGGVAPFTFAINSGNLPSGLSITSAGNISGTITASVGTFSFTAKVTDSQGNVAVSGTISIKVDPALTITPPTFPAGVVGVSYPAETFTATGGSTTGYTFALASGALPSPLTVGANGTIASGMPTTAGISTFTVKVTDSQGYTATTTSLSIIVNQAPAITTNPANQTVTTGSNASFTAAASGSPAPTVQWQVSTNNGVTFIDVGGATSPTLVLTAVTAGQNGNQYRAVFTNAAGSATTTSATLTVDVAPLITQQPSNQTVNAGSAATFTAAASGNPAPTVLWQVSADGGVTFTNVAGATSPTLSFTTTSLQNGNQYRAVFTNAVSSVTSATATLTVDFAPAITANPTSQTVVAGNVATFTASASGNPAPTAQWQVSTDSGATFNNVAGATSPTLSFTAAFAQNGNQYRAVFTNSLGNITSTAATLTVNVPPAITTNPSSQTVTAGSVASFAAGASGTPAPTVQWQVSTDGGLTFTNIAGATSTTFSFTTTAGQNGNQYRAVFTNAAGSVTSSAATLNVNSAPAITQQPTNQTVGAGATATFTASASGNPAPTVQWQVSTDGGATFTNVGGATSTTLSFTAASGQNGNQFHAVFTNSLGNITSSAATLTVTTAPAITTNPSSQTVNSGSTASFTAVASGTPAPTVQWQFSTDGGVTFTNVAGATSTTLSFIAGAAQNGYQYRAVFTNTFGNATTSSATLTVDFAPTITQSPANQTVAAGTNAIFTAIANGNPPPTVQWQVSTDGGATFNNVGGATSTTLTVTAVTTAQNGNLYRAVFTNSLATVTTSSATLTVTAAPAITLNPSNQTVTAGSNATFTAAASGTPAPTVQWQGSVNGGAFANITGATSTTLTLTGVTATQNGNRYQAVFTNSTGNATTTPATLTVNFAPTITQQPSSQTVGAGGLATFTALANGNPAPTVQWQVSTDGGATFTNVIGATSTTLSFTTGSAQNGNQYRATFTNSLGSINTNVATLTVTTAPGITTNPSSQTVNSGNTASFTAAATGTPAPTVQWQVSTDGGVTFANVTGATSSTLSFTATAVQNGNQYRAVFTNASGNATTSSASLTVDFAPAITQQPSSQTVTVGANATFTALANGNPAPTVQWQVSTDGGVTFNNISGATSTTLTLTAVTLAQSGSQYRAVFTNTLGNATTSAATLTVVPSCTNNCTLSGTVTNGQGLSGLTVTITGPSPATTVFNAITDANGNYSFSGVTAGQYSVSFSPGYTTSPVTPLNLTINSNTVQNLTATPTFSSSTITGTVSYSGTQIVRRTFIRVSPGGCNGCNAVAGTSITLTQNGSTYTGSYTVRGLLPVGSNNNGNGTYTVSAQIDTTNNGQPNASNPQQSSGTVTVNSPNVTVPLITMVDPSPAPQTPTGLSVILEDQGGVAGGIVMYNAPQSNGEEIATSYTLSLGTDTNASNLTPIIIPAHGTHDSVYILSNLTAGVAYYFKISAFVGTTPSPVSPVFGPVTPAVGTGPNTVSATVTFQGTATGPLYVGVIDQSQTPNVAFGTRIATPVSGTTYSVTGVPNGTYQVYAIIDNNQNGTVDVGDFNNVSGQNGTPTITLAGGTTPLTIALTNAAATPYIATNHQASNGNGDSYWLNLGLTWGTLRPVAATLISGPNVTVPWDLPVDQNNNAQNQGGSVIPLVGDTYTFQVTLLNPTTQAITTQTLTYSLPAIPGTSAAVINSFAQNLTMITSGPEVPAPTPTVPYLSWAAPSPLVSFPYTYQVGLNGNNNGVNWYYSGGKHSNGIPSTQLSVQFNIDGAATNNGSSITSLPLASNFNWQVSIQDANGDQAQSASAMYSTPGGVGPATKLVFTQQPGDATAGSTMPTVNVAIEDASGNIVTSATNQITLSILNNAGGGILSGGGPVSPVNGVATFSNLSINNAGTGYTVSATSSPALTSAASSAFNVAGAATQIAFTVQPSNANTGVAITPAVQVAIEDAAGRIVTNATNQITLSLNNAGGATLSGGGPIGAVNGVATFSTLSINNPGTGYTLSATSSPVLTTPTSNAFNVTTGPPIVTSNASAVFPIFAAGPSVNFTFTVSNDVAGDVVTVNLTVDANTGGACTTATCGTLPGGGLVAQATSNTGGAYSILYTPPTSLSAQVVPTLFVTSSINTSFPATDSIEVDPAGVPLVQLGLSGGGAGIVQPNTAQRTLTATVYNDPGGLGVTFAPITGSGYACANIGANSCGALGTASPPSSVSGVTTNTIPYTPPAAVPSAPYDRPRLQATSVANPTQFTSIAFRIGGNPASTTGLRIPVNQKFNSALATSTTPISVTANFGNDTGNLRTVTWKLTSGGTGGADCSGPCGTLSAATATGNGLFVSSTINYTPPATVPGVTADLTPTITATSVDNAAATDSFTFNIVDGTCPSATATTNGVLSGQYAFLLRGLAGQGYGALIGSFTANGSGGITGGFYDANRNAGVVSDVPIVATGSSYSVGPDNRGCLYLNDASGIPFVFRFSLGTLVGGIATEGRIIRFEDNVGRGPRQSGVLMKQDPTSFNAGALSGPYAFGLEGVNSNGGRNAGAGVFTANGAGTLSNLSEDFDSVGGPTGVLTGSGSYTMATNAPSGRGTATVTINVSGGTATSHSVLYMVSSSEVLLMNTDALGSNTPILSGEVKKQTGPFTPTSLDGKSYLFYTTGLSNSDGTNEATVGHFTFTTNGQATGVIDDNGNPESSVAGTFTVASNGRVTLTSGGGTHPPIFYLVNSSLAFVVDTSSSVASGFFEQQTGGPFSTASISGQYFFGAEAPTTGSSYASGTANFNAATGVITGNEDSSRSDGLRPSNPISNNGTPVTYCFATSTCTPATTAAGQGNVGGSLAYIISPSKIIFMDTSNQGGGTSPVNRNFVVIQK